MRSASELSSSTELFGEAKTSAPFIETLRALNALKRREEVKALMFVLNAPQLGWAQAEELAQALKALKESGREVLLYCPHLTPESYVVASEAHEVWVSPTSEVMISGLLQERFYLKGLLDRLHIKAEFIAVGDYKSAPEMFTREGPSEQASEANNALLQARYDLLTRALMHRASAEGAQGIEAERARAEAWLKEGPYSAQEALKVGLVNRVVNAVSLEHALRTSRPHLKLTADQVERRGEAWGPTPQLAALLIEGEIGGGRLGGGARAASLVPLIRDLTYNEQVKGVLLRVDSPGGAISDADELWRALSELAKRKPLVASMGNLAASGGYYVVAPALKIFASPNTLTGSIGVFAGKVDLSPLLASLGVQVHRSQFGEGGGEQSLFTPWSEAQRSRLKRSMEQMYGLFLDRVTAGRPHLTRERLLPLAGGRVWTGKAACERGLVDVEGGVLDALAYLAYRAGLDDVPYELKVVAPSPPSLLSQASRLSGRVFGSADLQQSAQESTHTLTPLLTQLERAPLPPSLKALLRLTLAHPSQALAYLPSW
jgi:protease-4